MTRNKHLKTLFLNHLMVNGKKWKSESILFNNIKRIQKKQKKKTSGLVKLAVVNSAPFCSMKKIKRQKKKAVEFPFMLNFTSRTSSSVKQVIESIKTSRNLEVSLINANNKTGAVIDKNRNLYKTAFSVRKLANYRWFY